MRNIKFRGKKKSDGKWLFGDLIHGNIGDCYIFDCENFCKENAVNPDTVGQFAELYDKYNNEIYEDDIIVWTIYHADFDGLGVLKKDIKYEGVVKWHQGGFVLKDMEGDGYYSISSLSSNVDFEIIGNIHNNPELLKGDYKNDNRK